MNVVTKIFGVAVNILLTPFANNVDTGVATGQIFGFNWFPSRLLNLDISSIPPCKVIYINMGEHHQMKFSVLPRGYCWNCCPVKVGRDMRFVLYNKLHRDKGVIIEPHNEVGAARRAGVNNTMSTIIFVHGFSEVSPGESGRAIIDAYLSRPDDGFNIILLDWSDLGAFPWYKPAVENVKLVGNVLREFIETFHDSGEIPIGNVHVVGFSLGAHVASQAGKQLRSDLRIPRITALDPAFPEFSIKDSSRRLTESDADYIDVIHTDAGVLGLPIPVGHADFYPNGGKARQPGCQPSYLAQRRLIDQVFACSHARAWHLYAESVRSKRAFPATKCKIWNGPHKQCNFTLDAHMGYENTNATGQFYLSTNRIEPFSLTMDNQILNLE